MDNDKFPVKVVLYPSTDNSWIAQGLEFDIMARGSTPADASERFNQKFGAELIMSMEIGDTPPLTGVPRAPKEFWDMYESAKERPDIEASIQVKDGATSRIHQHVKITDEHHSDAA
jgi:hypothetical protein